MTKKRVHRAKSRGSEVGMVKSNGGGVNPARTNDPAQLENSYDKSIRVKGGDAEAWQQMDPRSESLYCVTSNESLHQLHDSDRESSWDAGEKVDAEDVGYEIVSVEERPVRSSGNNSVRYDSPSDQQGAVVSTRLCSVSAGGMVSIDGIEGFLFMERADVNDATQFVIFVAAKTRTHVFGFDSLKLHMALRRHGTMHLHRNGPAVQIHLKHLRHLADYGATYSLQSSDTLSRIYQGEVCA